MSLKVEDLCSHLVQIKSTSGGEKEIVDFLKDLFTQMGFDEINIDRYGSIVAVMRGERPGKKLLFDSHIDTVGIPKLEDWTKDPFGGQIEDGRVYGRGCSDMKGPMAAAISGVEAFVRKNSRDFAGEILISGVVHEECFEGVAAREISQRYQPDYVIICETTDLKLNYGQRGRMEVSIETIGKPCHSSSPEKGINAVYHMAQVIPELRKIELDSDPDLGPAILELVDICSEPYPGASVIPARCRATYDVRTLTTDSADSILARINEVLDRLSQRIPDFKASASLVESSEVCYTGETITAERFFPAWKSDPESTESLAILSAMEKAGLPPSKSVYSFCTNGSHYGGEAGLTVYGFGPSQETQCHMDDEYIEISQLEKAAEVYQNICENLLSL